MTTVSDDFNRANGGLGANWTNVENSPQISSNAVTFTNSTTAMARFNSTIATGNQNCKVTIVNHGVSGANKGPCIRFSGSSCYLFSVRNSTTNTYRLFLYSGSSSFTLLGSAVDAAIPSTPCDAEIEIVGNRLSGRINGVEVISHTLASDTLSAAQQVGLYVNNSSVVDDFVATDDVVVSSLSITSPVVNQIIQRTGTTFASGTASIQISGTYSGTPTAIEARFNGGEWATIVASPSDGAFSGTLTSQLAGQGAVEVRFSNDTGVTASVADVGIGEVFCVFGQSNAVCLATNPQSWTAPSAYTHYKPGAAKLGSTWSTLADHPFNTTEEPAAAGKGSCYPRLATLLMRQLGVPVGFICVGKGSTGLIGGGEAVKRNHWQKNGTGANGAEQYNKAVTTVNSTVNPNAVRAVIWYQGEADTLGSGAGDNAGRGPYAAAVSQLLDNLQADCTSLANAKMIVATLSEYVRADTSTSDLTAIRMAQIDAVEADADLFLGPVGYEINHSDDGHWLTDTNITRLGNLWYCSISTALFSGAEGYSPELVSAQSTDTDEITLTFDRDLLTSDSTYTTSAFAVVDDSGTITISSATRTGARTVVLALGRNLAANPNVSLGRGNNAVGATVPRSANVTLPDASTINLTAQPFEAVPVVTPTPTITVTSPTVSQVVLTGSFTIQWTSEFIAGTVDILFSKDNGVSFSVIVAATANDGSHAYTFQPNQAGTQCVVRVRSTDDNAVFDDSGVFVLATTQPGAGGAWKLLAKQLAIEAGYEVS